MGFPSTAIRINESNLKSNFNKFTHKIRCKWHFRNELTEKVAFCVKSYWNPPYDHPSLEIFLSKIEKEILILLVIIICLKNNEARLKTAIWISNQLRNYIVLCCWIVSITWLKQQNSFMILISLSIVTLTLFRMGGGRGGGKKAPPTSFSPVTSANVGFGSQNFLTFSFNPFTTLVQNIKLAPSASRKLLNLNQDHPSKKAIFLVKSL